MSERGEPSPLPVLEPEWPAPRHVRACCTLRTGGVSRGLYASLNLALHVGDDPDAVQKNRARVRTGLALPAEPCWLEQVHGCEIVAGTPGATPLRADGSFTTCRDRVLAIMTADCLPILLCDRAGSVIIALHAGWRGLLDGIIGKAIAAWPDLRGEWLAWIGPGIGPAAYVVGAELASRFHAAEPAYDGYFRTDASGDIRADLGGLAEWQLRAAGVDAIYRFNGCTAADPHRFYSFRRDGVTGRFATLIWMT